MALNAEKDWHPGEVPTGDLLDAYLSANGVIYNGLQESWEFEGDLVTFTGGAPWPAPFDLTIVGFYLGVGTAPTGAAILLDVHKGATTIFTNQDDRPTIAISATVDTLAVPAVTAVDAGDLLTVEVDQIGSTIAGANARLTMFFRGA